MKKSIKTADLKSYLKELWVSKKQNKIVNK